MNILDKDILRFNDKYYQREDGCWIWLKYTQKNGYGNFRLNGINCLFHRISFIIYKGDIPKNKMVLHTCDNRNCVNPDHLYLGTHQDNMNDMKNRNRQHSIKGEQHHSSVLSDYDVKLIRDFHKMKIKQIDISKMFFVSHQLISAIVNNKIRLQEK